MSSYNFKEWHQYIFKIICNGYRSNIILHNVPKLAQKPMDEIVAIVNNHFGSICRTYPPHQDNMTMHSDFKE